MKYPFLLAALLLCSANLAARHSDTDTLLQPDTLSSGNPTRSPPRNPTRLSSARLPAAG
ncbi:MAG: hypothetical protein ACLRMJ_05210 [Alistipes finegoldii]